MEELLQTVVNSSLLGRPYIGLVGTQDGKINIKVIISCSMNAIWHRRLWCP